jgi:hypothetical protein
LIVPLRSERIEHISLAMAARRVSIASIVSMVNFLL